MSFCRLPLDVGGGELPVLPLSIAGAVSMTHLPDGEAFLSGDEWFIFKFDKQQVRRAAPRQHRDSAACIGAAAMLFSTCRSSGSGSAAHNHNAVCPPARAPNTPNTPTINMQQAGLSGLAFDEGTFGVFGYVTSGLGDVVAKLESGDVIVSARITSGLDRLVRPAAAE